VKFLGGLPLDMKWSIRVKSERTKKQRGCINELRKSTEGCNCAPST
jgi:hypothetical protein